MKKPYDKAIATDISTTVSDPEIKNAVSSHDKDLIINKRPSKQNKPIEKYKSIK